MMVEKYIKNGFVAVAISPGFGAGWSSWNTEDKEVEETRMFHHDIIQMILDGKKLELTTEWLVEKFGEKFKYVYTGGKEQLEVHWIAIGTKFKIEVLDGYESIIELDDFKWFEANY